jgi:integrase
MAEGIEYRCGCRGGDGKKLGKGCPSYGKRGHGAFYPRISIVGPDGRRRQPTLGGFPTITAARQARDKAVANLRGGFDLDRSQTVADWLEEWLGGKRQLRATTRRSYRQHLDDYLIPLLGQYKLQQLRAAHINSMIDAMLAGIDRPKTDKRPAVELRPGSASVRRVHATLRSALNAAVKQQRLTVNPALHVELPPASRRRVEPWSAEELGAFLDAAAKDRLSALYELIALAGLRRGEAIGLRWSDVDLRNGVITIRWQVVDNGGAMFAGPPKTDSGERLVDLDDGTAGVLLAHQIQQSIERAAMGVAWHEATTLPHQETGQPVTLTGLVFTYEDGRALRPEFVTRRMQRIARDAALGERRLHDLRHGSASLQLAAGVPLAIVSKRLGHSSITITSDLYSHLLRGVGKQAAEAAAALVPRAPREAVSISGTRPTFADR